MSRAKSQDITLYFDSSKCVHARRCVLGAPDVFRPGTPGGWMFPEHARAAEIARVVDGCPSGALSYVRHDGGMGEQVPMVNTVRPWENGPNELRGDIRIGDEDPATRVLLCRCGQSKNKPYCDNSHIDAGFTATGEPSGDPDGETPVGGVMKVKPLPDGPLVITGSVEVIAGSGRRLAAGDRHVLCRCGHSKNKPFCDGSHAEVGFEAP